MFIMLSYYKTCWVISLDLVKVLVQFSEMERKHSEELNTLADQVGHPVLKALFKGIAKDSEKHSYMYQALADLLSRTQPFISEKDLQAIATVIKKHIETENKMLEEARRLLNQLSDPRAKLILSAIADDEARHHAVLKSIERRIAEEETLSEQIVWDMIWKDSPWHGTPGG